jgi:hypothetical protein
MRRKEGRAQARAAGADEPFGGGPRRNRRSRGRQKGGGFAGPRAGSAQEFIFENSWVILP